jgi:hypothetical protein
VGFQRSAILMAFLAARINIVEALREAGEFIMKLSQDLKPVSYFKNNMAAILQELNENQGTMIITQNGETKAAIRGIQAKY